MLLGIEADQDSGGRTYKVSILLVLASFKLPIIVGLLFPNPILP
jgi:hypothetical protein